jgi:hypothetical protein
VKAMRTATPTEHDEQVALMDYCWANRQKHPELSLLFAIANAGAGAQRGQAGKMKAEGVKAGVPDMLLPVARNGYHGLFIEMKRTGGVLSPIQLAWIARLKQEGYMVRVCYGFEQARDVLVGYLEG